MLHSCEAGPAGHPDGVTWWKMRDPGQVLLSSHPGLDAWHGSKGILDLLPQRSLLVRGMSAGMTPGEASRNTTQLSPTQVQNREQTPGWYSGEAH